MACFHPMEGWRLHTVNPVTGKKGITFKRKDADRDPSLLSIAIPCGKCLGCRMDRSRSWAIRCMHEASMYERNCFITLTYDDKHLPEIGSLQLRDFQLFMKKLRKQFGNGIRFFHCGEYGPKYGRPHYHAILFNFDFPDKEPWKVRNGFQTWRSKSLEKIWKGGFSEIGSVSFESAAYVARYITKKQTTQAWWTESEVYDKETGEMLGRRSPEYTTMSRRPGIGRPWLDKFRSDVYTQDMVVMGGREMRPPKFYDGVFELDDPEGFAKVKAARIERQKLNWRDSTPDRLAVREFLLTTKFRRLPRGYEDGSDQ
jgi:hypothetical protein